MSSIDEKLRTFESIIGQLQEVKKMISDDRNGLQHELNAQKGNWNDEQMKRFSGNDYAEKFNNGTELLISRIDNTISFLEHKYETLKTHRD